MKPAVKFGLLAGWVVVGSLVILAPHFFVVKEDLETVDKRQGQLLSLQNKFSREGITENLAHATRDAQRAQEEIKTLNSKKPWSGATPAPLQMAIHDAEERLHSAASQHAMLLATKDNMLTQMRALSPVFSELAWQESRELFKKRQEEYAGTSMQMWKWSMMFDMMFRGMGRDDNPLAFAAQAVAKLFMRLSVGSVMALVDFTIRLPFWIKEYQQYAVEDFMEQFAEEEDCEEDDHACRDQPPKTGDDYESMYEEDHTGQTGMGQRLGGGRAEGRSVGWGAGGLMSSLAGIGFWLLAVSAAALATVVIIVVIWSPFIALFGFAIWKARKDGRMPGGRGGRGANGDYRQYRGQQHRIHND